MTEFGRCLLVCWAKLLGSQSQTGHMVVSPLLIFYVHCKNSETNCSGGFAIF